MYYLLETIMRLLRNYSIKQVVYLFNNLTHLIIFKTLPHPDYSISGPHLYIKYIL